MLQLEPTIRTEIMSSERNGTTIVVGIDGSPGSQAAAVWAIDETRLWHTELEAVFAWHLATMAYRAPGFVPPTADEIETAGQRVLEQVLSAAEDRDEAKLQLRVFDGRPADIIRRVADEPQVGLVVVGSRGHNSISDVLLGSVSHELSHRCPKPLVIVPRNWTRPRQPTGRIVVGVDGSPESLAALRWAASEAIARHASLEVVAVWTLGSEVAPDDGPAGEPIEAALESSAQEMADRAVAGLGRTELEAKTIVASGTPAAVLIERAEGADMLVVGTRGLGRVREALFGSVGHACAHHARVPVVIVAKTGSTEP
jgi:nucleotide-binding universal stress UspA family protein